MNLALGLAFYWPFLWHKLLLNAEAAKLKLKKKQKRKSFLRKTLTKAENAEQKLQNW